MARRRLQQVPWKAAGRTSEVQASADDVVREVGWVFTPHWSFALPSPANFPWMLTTRIWLKFPSAITARCDIVIT